MGIREGKGGGGREKREREKGKKERERNTLGSKIEKGDGERGGGEGGREGGERKRREESYTWYLVLKEPSSFLNYCFILQLEETMKLKLQIKNDIFKRAVDLYFKSSHHGPKI